MCDPTISHDGLHEVRLWAEDMAENRTKVVEHTGRTVEYTYDDTYKLLKEKITNPDNSTSVISYTYDKVGNRLTKIENGVTTTYQYNENNQLVKEDDITYSYDDNGNLKEKNSAEENITYFYDAENHLTRVETTRFGATIVVEYEYDAYGRLDTVTDPDGVSVTRYTYDAHGNKESVISPNGIITEYGYDNLNRLISVETRTLMSDIMASYAYTLNSKGQRTHVEEHVGEQI